MLNTGLPGTDDPRAGMHKPFPAASVGRVVGDGGDVRLGNLELTAMTTPGHTPGRLAGAGRAATAGSAGRWSMPTACRPSAATITDSPTTPTIVAAYRASIAKIAASRCEILLTPHPSASAMRDRMTGKQPLFDTEGCRDYAATLTKRLDERLAKEKPRQVSWRVTLNCTREEAEALPESADLSSTPKSRR